MRIGEAVRDPSEFGHRPGKLWSWSTRCMTGSAADMQLRGAQTQRWLLYSPERSVPERRCSTSGQARAPMSQPIETS